MEFLSWRRMCSSNQLGKDILYHQLYWLVMHLLRPQDRCNQSYSYHNTFKALLPRHLSSLIMPKMG